MPRNGNTGTGSWPGNGGGSAALSGTSERCPWDLLLLAVAALILVAHSRLHSFVPGAAMLRPGLLLAVVALGLWFLRRDEWIRSPLRLRNPVVAAASFMVIWAAVGVPFALWQGGAARFLIDNFGRTFLVFLLVVAAVRNVEDIRRLVGVIGFGVATFAVLSPMPGIGRGVRGGGYDPNDAAMLFASGLPALVFFVLHGRNPFTRIAAGVGGLAVLSSLILTQSRGGFLAVVAVLFFMVFMLKGVRPVLRAGVVGLVVLASVPFATTEFWERMETITELDDGYGEGGTGGRRNIWARAIGYTTDNPITGVGIGNFTVAEGGREETRDRIAQGVGVKFSAAHSIWFQVMAELGIPGILAFMGCFWFTLQRLRQLQRRRWPARVGSMTAVEVVVMTGILMAIIVGALVAGTFLSNGYSSLVWIPLSVCVGLIKVIESGIYDRGGSVAPDLPPRHVATFRPSTRTSHADAFGVFATPRALPGSSSVHRPIEVTSPHRPSDRRR